jgi:hypothetical protein
MLGLSKQGVTYRMTDQSYQPPQVEIADTPPTLLDLVEWAQKILQMPGVGTFSGVGAIGENHVALAHQIKLWEKALENYHANEPEPLDPAMVVALPGSLTLLEGGRVVLGAPAGTRQAEYAYLAELVRRWLSSDDPRPTLVLPFPVIVNDAR